MTGAGWRWQVRGILTDMNDNLALIWWSKFSNYAICINLALPQIPVALSKYVGEAEPLALIERFVTGYMQTGKLSDAEIECMPDMVRGLIVQVPCDFKTNFNYSRLQTAIA